MIDKDRILEELKKIKEHKIQKDQLLILLLVGILLLVITVPVGDGKKSESGSESGKEEEEGLISTSSNVTEQEYASSMERQLESILSQMEGVGEVKVMITLRESAEKVIEKDIESSSENVSEKDSQGGERTTISESRGETTIYEESADASDSLSGQTGEPYVSKEITPRVEGVVVVASGGDDAVVIKNITEAVQALFDIDTHKIRIVKKK